MRVYALISQKGGSGKSTLAAHFATLAGEEGQALLIDRDPQGTTAKWWSRRADLDPPPAWPELVDLEGQPLAAALAGERDKPGALFVDTPGRAAEPEAEAARAADIVLIPVKPTIKDLEAVLSTVEMVKRLRRPAALIINAARNEARAKDARAALSEHGVPVCPHYLTDRTVYHDADIEGRTVMEMRGSAGERAATEMRAIWKWIKETAK